MNFISKTDILAVVGLIFLIVFFIGLLVFTVLQIYSDAYTKGQNVVLNNYENTDILASIIRNGILDDYSKINAKREEVEKIKKMSNEDILNNYYHIYSQYLLLKEANVNYSDYEKNYPIFMPIENNALENKFLILESLDKKTLFVKIYKFRTGLADEFFKELKKYKNRYENLIIDVVDNPGGKAEETYKLLDGLVERDSKKIFKLGNGKEYIDNKPNMLFAENYILLQNEYSASASEVLMDTIKTYKNATIIGKTSFGKDFAIGTLNIKGIRFVFKSFKIERTSQINKEKNKLKPDIETDDFLKTLEKQEIILSPEIERILKDY